MKKLLTSWFALAFGSNGVSTFEGVHTCVAIQIHEKWSPSCLATNCNSHKTNITIHVMSNYSVVVCLKNLSEQIYFYFNKSNKYHNELQN